MRLDVVLHGVRDIAQTLPRPALRDGEIEALARDVEQLLDPRGDLSDRHRERTVGVIPLDDTPEVQPDDIALLHAAMRGGNSMNDLFVDGDAHRRRTSSIALEGRLCPARHHESPPLP